MRKGEEGRRRGRKEEKGHGSGVTMAEERGVGINLSSHIARVYVLVGDIYFYRLLRHGVAIGRGLWEYFLISGRDSWGTMVLLAI